MVDFDFAFATLRYTNYTALIILRSPTKQTDRQMDLTNSTQRAKTRLGARGVVLLRFCI